jgi:hypothetical protein
MLRLGRDGLTILRDEVLSDPKLEPVGEGPARGPASGYEWVWDDPFSLNV